MSETKHTPGPWKWTRQYRDSLGAHAFSLVDAGGYGILSCDGEANSPQMLGGRGEANARLIAAAPDLLEALEAICEMQERTYGYGIDTHIELARLVVPARAAIAKATGAEPATTTDEAQGVLFDLPKPTPPSAIKEGR